MFVGEQPGDQEDLAGKPFVGPAGQVFDQALAEAGVDRAETYVTNAVKHFKFEPRGKRRCTRRRTTARSTPAAGGSTRNWRRSVRSSLSRWARRRRSTLPGKPVPITKMRGQVVEREDECGCF